MSISVLGIGDNVVDKYLHSGIMYPGGNALNFAVYAKLADIPSAFMGAFGNDDAAQHVQDVLHQLQIDISHSRHYTGEMGMPVSVSRMVIDNLSPATKTAYCGNILLVCLTTIFAIYHNLP